MGASSSQDTEQIMSNLDIDLLNEDDSHETSAFQPEVTDIEIKKLLNLVDYQVALISPAKTQNIQQKIKDMDKKLLSKGDCKGVSNSSKQLEVIDLTEISEDDENKNDVEIVHAVHAVIVENIVDGTSQALAKKRKLDSEDTESKDPKITKKFQKINEDACRNADDEDNSPEMGMMADISDIVDQTVDYNSELTFDEATQKVMNVLPNVDPNYIQKKIMSVLYRFRDHQLDFNYVINELCDEPNLPQRRLNQEVKNIDIENASKMTPSDFLEKYTDPHAHFSSIQRNVSDTYNLQAEHHLNRLYSTHGEAVQKILEINNFHLFPSVVMLENRDPGKGKQPQQKLPDRPEKADPEFVEEAVYCRLACYVRQQQWKLKNIRKKKIAIAQSYGQILPDCSKCYKECLTEEVINCNKEHWTCQTCIMNTVQKHETYEGQVHCQCGEVLSTIALKKLVPSRMMDQLERRMTNHCPICNEPGLKKFHNVFVCAVVECGKEICKFCWKENHPNENCGNKQGSHEKDNDIFSFIKQWDKMIKEGDGQICYRKKLEATGRHTLNSSNKFDNLNRLAEWHYFKMLARDTYALNAQIIPNPRPMGGTMGPQFNNYNIPKSIEIIINKELVKKFQFQKDTFKKNGLRHDEILAFHGTSQESADSIILNNFSMDKVKHGQLHGKGIYLSEFPNFARRYGDVLVLCRVLPGHEYEGDLLGVPQGWNSKKVKPSTDQYGEQILIDNVDQILPVFVIYFNSSPQQNPQRQTTIGKPSLQRRQGKIPQLSKVPWRLGQPFLQYYQSLKLQAKNVLTPIPPPSLGQLPANTPPPAHTQPSVNNLPFSYTQPSTNAAPPAHTQSSANTTHLVHTKLPANTPNPAYR